MEKLKPTDAPDHDAMRLLAVASRITTSECNIIREWCEASGSLNRLFMERTYERGFHAGWKACEEAQHELGAGSGADV